MKRGGKDSGGDGQCGDNLRKTLKDALIRGGEEEEVGRG